MRAAMPCLDSSSSPLRLSLGIESLRRQGRQDEADAVYEVVAKTFADLGVDRPAIPTILLKDGYFVGHKLQCGGMQAVWMVGEDCRRGRLFFGANVGTLDLLPGSP